MDGTLYVFMWFLLVLKEEPDDLTHLAPTAGDTCIPLDDSTPLFGEMFDELIIPEHYSSLLTDDINSLDSQSSRHNVDPFITYKDESNDTNSSPSTLLSPSVISKVSEL